MKYVLFTIITLFNINLYAQKPCEYSVDVKDSIGTYKETKSCIVHERNFGGTSSYVFFSLALTDGMPTLNVQTLQKSKDFIKANCLDKNSKVFLQLDNGKIITLIATDDENCGTSLRDDLGFNNRISTGKFMFLKGTLEDLKSAPVSSIRIKYTTETLDFIFKKELLSEMDGKTYFPGSYFIDALYCIEN